MTEPVDFQDHVAAETENSEKGASLVEYALLVALIAVVAIVGVRALGVSVSNTFSAINTNING